MLLLCVLLSGVASVSPSLYASLRVVIDQAPLEHFTRVLRVHLRNMCVSNIQVRAEVEKYQQSTLYTSLDDLVDQFMRTTSSDPIRKMRPKPISPGAILSGTPLPENPRVTASFLAYVTSFTSRFGLFDLPAAILNDFDAFFTAQTPLEMLTTLPATGPTIPDRKGFTIASIFRDDATLEPVSATILISTDGNFLYDLRQKCKVRIDPIRRILMLPSHKAASALNAEASDRMLYYGRDGVLPLGTLLPMSLFPDFDNVIYIATGQGNFLRALLNSRELEVYDSMVPEMIQRQGRCIPLTVMTDRMEALPVTEFMKPKVGISVLGFSHEIDLRVVFDAEGASERSRRAVTLINFNEQKYRRAAGACDQRTSLPGRFWFCQLVIRLCERSNNLQTSMAELIESIDSLYKIDDAGLMDIIEGRRNLPRSPYHRSIWIDVLRRRRE